MVMMITFIRRHWSRTPPLVHRDQTPAQRSAHPHSLRCSGETYFQVKIYEVNLVELKEGKTFMTNNKTEKNFLFSIVLALLAFLLLLAILLLCWCCPGQSPFKWATDTGNYQKFNFNSSFCLYRLPLLQRQEDDKGGTGQEQSEPDNRGGHPGCQNQHDEIIRWSMIHRKGK